MLSGIYCIYNLITRQFYVGKTQNIDKRFYDHMKFLNANSHQNCKLQEAWNKYGADAFELEVLELVPPYDKHSMAYALERELFWINMFDACYNGYNILHGGIGGNTFMHNPNLDSIKKKLSDFRKQHTGWKHSEDTKLKISKSQIEYCNDATVCKSRSIQAKKQWSNEDRRKAHSEIMKKYCKDNPEKVKERLVKLSKNKKEYFSKEENRKKVSDGVKKHFSNPENKRKHSEIMKKYYANKRKQKELENNDS